MSTLSQYFPKIAMKRLVSGELPYNQSKGRNSTQHEFNGTKEMIQLFGTERIESKVTTYLYLSDKEDKSLTETGTFSFYNSREGKPRSAEYRIYYSSKNAVVDKASEGDLLFIGKTLDDKELFIIAEKNSTVEKQLTWLFSLKIEGSEFQIKDLSEVKSNLVFVQKYILDAIGVEVEESSNDLLEEMLEKFKGDFPTMLRFSEFSRSKAKNVNAIDDPDETVIKWYEMEFELFRSLEKYLITKKLNLGFGVDGKDVEDFLKFSLSAHQRRKSRAGDAFENHLSKIFDAHKIHYSKGQITELNKQPDFIFPGIKEYHNANFDVSLLTFLGVKTTAKDRWRQVLSEAAKIKRKHLITLEPSISENQTEEMVAENLQLVIPKGIFQTYTYDQQKQIISLNDFISLVKNKQLKTTT